MIKHLTFLLIALTFHLVCIGQKLPSKKVQYDFLTWYAAHTQLIALSDTTSKFTGDFNSAKEFNSVVKVNPAITNTERKYLNRQIKIVNQPVTLDSVSVKGAIWKAIPTQTIPGTYISLPIFTIDKKTVFIYRIFICGSLCGQAGIEVYAKTKNDKWKVSEAFHFPIAMF